MRPPCLLLLLLALLLGCVERSSHHLGASEGERIAALVSSVAPSPQHPLDIAFDDDVVLVGYDVDAESWPPGRTLRVTWHWKVVHPPPVGFALFTHVTDASGNTVLNADGVGETRTLLPPERWRAGTYVRDTQEIPLPRDFRSPSVSLRVGFWKGADRLPIVRGPDDGEGRAIALTLPSAPSGAAPPPEVPSLHVVRAEHPPRLDGVLDEPDWQRARSTAPFVQTMTGRPAEFDATARALWDDANLYVAFVVRDDDLRASHRRHDDHLWEQDCVELMLDPGGDGRNYFELQVSPANVTFDTRYDRRRVPQPFGHVDWDSGIRAGVAVKGTLDDGAEDQGYTVELAIPWSAFAVGQPPAARPEAGTEWRANFYVLDRRERGQRAAGWSPPRVGDFHVPPRFGRLLFTASPAAP